MALTKICIVGSGNVAFHFADLLSGAKAEVFIYSRNNSEAQVITNRFSCSFWNDLKQVNTVDLVILCVSDAAIKICLEEIPEAVPVVYTSGTVALTNLAQRKKLGVFYPLQSFTKDLVLQNRNFPILLECENQSFLSELKELGQKLTGNVVEAGAVDRRALHVSAVFANNFTNYLWHLSQEHLKNSNLDWNLLLPLLRESLAKLDSKSAFDVQTGPARRMDLETIETHEEQLSGLPKEIYQLLTRGILETYKNEKND